MGPESKLELRIKAHARAMRLHPFKFTSPGSPGVSDLIVMGEGVVAFIEVKSPGGRRSGPQRAFAVLLRRLGLPYLCTSDYDEAGQFLKDTFQPN